MSGRSSLWEGSKRSVSNAGFELVLIKCDEGEVRGLGPILICHFVK